MLNIARVIQPWKEADALSAHINLYGFWTETAFLTKSGDLGMVLSVAGVDYENCRPVSCFWPSTVWNSPLVCR